MTSIIKEMEVKYKTTSKKRYEIKITSPDATVDFLRDKLKNQTQEIFIAIYLDGANNISGWQQITVGLLNSCQVHPREVYKSALLCNCAAVIFAHNHPSNNPQPSTKDRDMTDQLKKAGDILGISVLDHLIITDDEHFSFHEDGSI